MLQWVTQLGIKYFRGIYSRNNLPQKIHKLETGIINLDDSMGGGNHWVCYRNVDKQYCEYFDPFGLIMPSEIKHYLKTSGKRIVYSSDEIHERDSVLCGYWCLYYLLERQKGKSLLLDVIHNPKFSFTNQIVNHHKLFYVTLLYMTEKFCVYCQEVTPHYVNQYGCFECCNCEPLSESDYESDSSHETYVPDSD